MPRKSLLLNTRPYRYEDDQDEYCQQEMDAIITDYEQSEPNNPTIEHDSNEWRAAIDNN